MRGAIPSLLSYVFMVWFLVIIIIIIIYSSLAPHGA
jgi:hypothetical protein